MVDRLADGDVLVLRHPAVVALQQALRPLHDVRVVAQDSPVIRVGRLRAPDLLVDLADDVGQVEDVHGGDLPGVGEVGRQVLLSVVESSHQRIEIIREPVGQLSQAVHHLANIALQVGHGAELGVVHLHLLGRAAASHLAPRPRGRPRRLHQDWGAVANLRHLARSLRREEAGDHCSLTGRRRRRRRRHESGIQFYRSSGRSNLRRLGIFLLMENVKMIKIKLATFTKTKLLDVV